ncbi:MAG: DinB family protein [Armatimonadota bacterium]
MPSIRDTAKGFTMETAQTLCKDATYIPEERLDWSPMDYGKSANAILSECAKANFQIAAAIRGGSPKEAGEGADFTALKDYVIDSAQKVCETIDSLSDSDLEADVQMPWGAIMPMSVAIFLPSSHMSYHDGQINYIQLLLGDTRFHWAEG